MWYFTGQKYNSIHYKRTAIAFRNYLQSQQKCSSKENFKNKYLTHSPPQDFFLAEIMENKNAAHNLLHCVVQLLLSICTSLIFIELRTQ